MSDDDEFLTAGQVAAKLSTSKTSVFSLAERGELTAYRISPKIVRFRRSDVDALLARSAS